MINIGEDTIDILFVGDMGVKEIAVGDEVIYTRSGGYFYLELNTKEE